MAVKSAMKRRLAHSGNSEEARVGKRLQDFQTHLICEGVQIEDKVFVGPA